ncbi:MAG TPA: hypothetical protein VGI83_05975 [Gemmatimonadales bacterium]
MHIELTEMLRCPEGHDDAFLVLATAVMKSRHVYSGMLGCPVCRHEIPVVNGVANFGALSADRTGRADSAGATAAQLQTLLGLSNAGGAVVLVGSAAKVAKDLGDLLGGTHVIGVNPPDGIAVSERVSLVAWGEGIPLRRNMARGVVLGAEVAHEPWLAESARVVLKGLRVVVLGGATAVPGLQLMAKSPEAWVGQRI